MSLFLLHPHGGMGDLLLSYPVVQAFADAYPDKKMFYVTPPGMEEVMQAHPSISRAFSLRPDAGSFKEILSVMRSERIEIGCALWTTARIAWLLRLSGAPVRIGQGGRVLYSFLFTHQVLVRSSRGDEESHWVECLLDYPRALGLDPKNKRISLTPSKAGIEKLRFLLERWKIPPNEPAVILHVGKGENVLQRGWPVDLFAKVADDLAKQGFWVIFTGSRKEIPLVEAVQSRMKRPSASAAGETDFQTLAALLRFARVVICPDSGPMHLAAAVQTPVVALFAMKKDFPKRWAPWQVEQSLIHPETFPCRSSCTKENCRDFRCYQALSPDEIVQAAIKLAAKPRSPVMS